MTIRVAVVEDDPAARKRLVSKIEESDRLRVAGVAATLAEAHKLVSETAPDVVLVDLQLPDGDGTELIRQQSSEHPQLPMLVISVFGDERRVVNAIRAGAQGYLLKDDEGEEIEDAICRITEGQSPISPAIATHLIRHFQAEPTEIEVPRLLSPRELETLQLAAKGLTYQEMARIMGVSLNTVGTFTKRIYTKLMVNSRVEAIYEARQLGLMPRD